MSNPDVENTSVAKRCHGGPIPVTLVLALLVVVASLHKVTPIEGHSWHLVHIAYRKLYYLPLLLATASAELGTVALMTLAASLLFALHEIRDWAGLPMLQAEGLSEIVSFWIFVLVATSLFSHWKRALAQTQKAHQETLDSLTAALELREVETGQHCRRVRAYALMLARQLKLPQERLEELSLGALLHDVGKIGIPDRILLKQGPLSPEEWELMRQHPRWGAELLGEIDHLRGAVNVVLCHHEKYDGTGYPRGLAAEEIPAAARIFAVADVFDAVTTDRPYHRARSYDETLALLREGRGRREA